MNIYLWSNPKITGNSNIVKYEFDQGVTMLIGPNGSGKTSALSQLDSIFNTSNWKTIEDNDYLRNEYACYYYNNTHEQLSAKQRWLDSGLTRRLASSFENSEGQDMWDYIYYKATAIGKTIRTAKETNKKGIFILIDGLDSGLSLDKINELRTHLLDFINKKETSEDFEVYIICSANSYEMCNHYNCIDVTNQNKVIFNNYEDFEKYFIKE